MIPKDIPKTLDEAIELLQKQCSPEDIELLKKEGHPPGWHFSGGMSLRNDWGLWHGSVLAKHFNSLGIYHADDMSGIIMESLIRKLRGQPLDVEGQVKHYRDYWAKENPKVNEGKPG